MDSARGTPKWLSAFVVSIFTVETIRLERTMEKVMKATCPLSQKEIVSRYFMENRSKLIDIAAFLDRLDRSVVKDEKPDFRINAFKEALRIVQEDFPGRVERVLEIMSDLTLHPYEKASSKGAVGAWNKKEGE